MKPETARRQIIDYTKPEMILHGVSRLTMDLIAQGMGMSKRTLYQLFCQASSRLCFSAANSARQIRTRQTLLGKS